MRSFVTGKTINKQVQLNNRLTTFTTPPITTGDLYVTRDLYVARDTHLNNLDICGNLVVTGNTFLNYLDVSSNVDISGNLTVSKDTYLNYLDVSSNADISGNLTIQKNVYSYGTMYAKTYLPGQIVNMTMLDNGQLGQNANFTIVTGNPTRSGTGYAFPEYYYTPKFANSFIIIEFQTIYTFIGGDGDSLEAELQVDSNTKSRTFQHWLNALGGGSRSGTIFPIVGRYENSNTNNKLIRVLIRNKTDDELTVHGDNSTWLKITEIGR